MSTHSAAAFGAIAAALMAAHNLGFSSWGVRIGPFTHNFTRRGTTIDTPGPGSLHRRRGGR